MSQIDGNGICLLLKECGGEIYQWKRLKIGIYALSKGSIENDGRENIFNYEFKKLCYVGPADSELEGDMVSMIMTGHIEKIRRQIPDDKTDHELISIKEIGKKAAENFERGLTTSELRSIKEVAENLTNLDNNASYLFNLYCSQWMEWALEALEAPLTP